MKEIQGILRQLQSDPKSSHALATLVTVEGSSYRRAGARLLVNGAGVAIGSISGGCLEADILLRARAVLADGVPQVAVYDTTEENDLVWGVGLGCQGVVRVLIERLSGEPSWARTLRQNQSTRLLTRLSVVWQANDPALFGTHEADVIAPRLSGEPDVLMDDIPPPIKLLIFGAGDDAQPMVRLAKELGWQVCVFDPRPAFAKAARFPAADEVRVAPPEATESVAIDAWTVAVIMSHRYVYDGPLLRALLPRELAYLGLLGPKLRTEKILGELAATGFAITEEMRTRLHGPVGLDLGGDTPETVALAVLAEIQSVLTGRDARPLRERDRPIHA